MRAASTCSPSMLENGLTMDGREASFGTEFGNDPLLHQYVDSPPRLETLIYLSKVVSLWNHAGAVPKSIASPTRERISITSGGESIKAKTRKANLCTAMWPDPAEICFRSALKLYMLMMDRDFRDEEAGFSLLISLVNCHALHRII